LVGEVEGRKSNVGERICQVFEGRGKVNAGFSCEEECEDFHSKAGIG
jgi:hypothetical protein